VALYYNPIWQNFVPWFTYLVSVILYVFHRPHVRIVNNFIYTWIDAGFFTLHTVVFVYAFNDAGIFNLTPLEKESIGWTFIWVCQVVLVVKLFVLIKEQVYAIAGNIALIVSVARASKKLKKRQKEISKKRHTIK